MITPLISFADDGISSFLFKYFVENRVSNKYTTWIVTDELPYGEKSKLPSYTALGSGDDLCICHASESVHILVIDSVEDPILRSLLADLSIAIVWNLDVINLMYSASESSISALKSRIQNAPQDVWAVYDHQFRFEKALDVFSTIFKIEKSAINSLYFGNGSMIRQEATFIKSILNDNANFYFDNMARIGVDNNTVYLQGLVLSDDISQFPDITWNIYTANLDYIVSIPRRWMEPNLEDNFKNLVS